MSTQGRGKSRGLLVAGMIAVAAATLAIARFGFHLALPGAVARASKPPLAPGEGTRQMSALLAKVLLDTDPKLHRFMNTKHVEYLRQQLAAAEPRKQVQIRGQLLEELINSGHPDEAIEEAGPILEAVKEGGPFADAALERMTLETRGLAWLRTGEQENCILHHGTQSCLAPIEGSGVHVDQRGSRQAMAEFAGVIERWPDDLSAVWLYNIAAMTVGEWPDKVRKDWLIPTSAFASEYDIGRFHDVAIPAGISVRGLSGGAITEDFDGDGDLDILLSRIPLEQHMLYFRNDGDGHFAERSKEAGLETITGGLNMVQADYDNDGDVDVFLMRGAWLERAGHVPDSLLRNNGDGTFEDVTEWAGLLSFHPDQAGAWGDYDNDGWVDLFVGNESSAGDTNPCELWHNNQDGTFTNRVMDLPQADNGYVKGVAWGDFNNDGRLDLYLSIHGASNRLLRNDGPRARPGPNGEIWQFTDVSAQAGVTEPQKSFPTWWFDYDNDGFPDIMVGGYFANMADVANMYLGRPNEVAHPKLYRNQHDGTFKDVTHEMHLDRVAIPMGANFGDLDNDGWLDCYFGTGAPALGLLLPNKMFRNAEGKDFQDVTTSGGFGHLQKGHGVAFADLDGDGDQDVLEEMGGAMEADVAFTVLFENPGHDNHWITLRLEGRKSNRSGIGARIRAHVRETAGERDIYLTAGSGGSFGASSLQQEMGLGKAQELVELEVTWPAAKLTQKFQNVAMDRYYHLVEGGQLEPVAVKAVKLGGGAR